MISFKISQIDCLFTEVEVTDFYIGTDLCGRPYLLWWYFPSAHHLCSDRSLVFSAGDIEILGRDVHF